MSAQHTPITRKGSLVKSGVAVRMANELNDSLQNVDRAAWPVRVIAYALSQGIETPLNADQLAAAMSQMPYWNQAPANFLDFVRAHAVIAKATGSAT